MEKGQIIGQLEQAWGEIPGWMKGWSTEDLSIYLHRLGWKVGSEGLSVGVRPEKVAVAEKLVSDSFGRVIRLSPLEIAGPGTGRAHIVRMGTSVRDPLLPKTVIVKLVNESFPWVSDKAELFRTFFNEWATYEFNRRLELPESVVPRFYGGDAEAGVMVIEDLGRVENAYTAAFGADAAHAEGMLIGWMKAVGRMHALSIGKQELFFGIRTALGPVPTRPSKTSQKRQMADGFRQTCALISVSPRRGWLKEIESVSAAVANPGAFFALSKVDNTPGDCVRVGSKLMLLDFEFGQFRHALLDATALRMIHPTAWREEYLTPTSVVAKAETAYRNELVKGCPQAEDDRLYNRAFAEAAAAWCLKQDGQLSPEFVAGLLEKDTGWRGRQRVVQRLRVLAETTEQFGHLPAIGATLRDLDNKLSDLWPTVETMAHYPAFRVANAPV